MSITNPRRLYVLLESLRSAALGTILPVFALYYRHFDITLFQIAVLAAVFEATILVSEIPTGIWADRVSRRSAIIISELCLATAGFLFVGLPGLLVFVIAEAVQGIGEAFASGSLEAWVVDESQIGEDRRATEALFATALRWKTMALLAGSVFAGAFGAHYLRWVWAPYFVLHVLALIVSLSLREKVDRSPGNAEASVGSIVSSGIQRLRHSRVLQVLVVFGLVCAFAEEGIDQFWQVYFNESLRIPVLWFGPVVALAALVVFLFAPKIIVSLGRRLSASSSVSVIQLFLAGGILGMTVFGQLPAVACLCAIFVLRDLKKPIVSAWANRHIQSAHRAGMLSFLNMISSVGEVGAGLVFGYLAGRLGLPVVFVLAGVLSVLVVFSLAAGRETTSKA